MSSMYKYANYVPVLNINILYNMIHRLSKKFLLQTYHIDIVLIISTRFCTRHNIDISIPIDSSKSTISIGLRCNRKPKANFTVGPRWRCYCKFKPHYTANENSIVKLNVLYHNLRHDIKI